MTARYRRINMLNEPNDAIGLDDNRRARWAFNVQAVKTPSHVFNEELAEVLRLAGIDAGVIFAGVKSTPPDGDDPILTIIETGGSAPQEIQNEIGAYPQPTAQIVGRGGNTKAVRALTYEAYDALKVIRNQTITAT